MRVSKSSFSILLRFFSIFLNLKLVWERLSRLVLNDIDTDSSLENQFFDFF